MIPFTGSPASAACFVIGGTGASAPASPVWPHGLRQRAAWVLARRPVCQSVARVDLEFEDVPAFDHRRLRCRVASSWPVMGRVRLPCPIRQALRFA